MLMHTLFPGKSEKSIVNGPLEYSVVRGREGGGGCIFSVSGGISAATMFNGYLSPGQRKEEPG